MTAQGKPKPIGGAANADFLRDELRNADWFTRNIAGFGVDASNTLEGLKQWLGYGDRDRIEANKVIAEEAPVGNVAGGVAMLAAPVMAAGAAVKGAAAIGGAYGFTRPTEAQGVEGGVERLKNAAADAALSGAGQKVANVAGKWLLDLQAKTNAGAQARNAVRDETLRNASDFVVPPSSVEPTWWNTLKEGFAGKSATAQAASNRNAPLFERAARSDLGLPEDVPLTPDLMRSAREKAYEVGYKPIADLPAVNWDPQFVKDVGTLLPARAGGAVKSAGHAEINDLVTALENRGQWTGEQLLQDIRQLRENATANFGGDAASKDLARAEKRAASYLEDLAERNIKTQGGDPEAMQLYREARQYIAQTGTVEKAINPATGAIDPRSWAKRVQDGKPLGGGEVEKAAMFAKAFPKASQPVSEIAGPGVSRLHPLLTSSILGGAGASVGGTEGGTIGTLAGIFGPAVVRRQMLGKASQNALRDLYNLSLASRAGVDSLGLLKYAPIGFAQARGKSLSE